MREINIQNKINDILLFIKKQLKNADMKKIIIGLSGGIDSSLTAALAIKVLGKENVIGVMMPYRLSNPDSLNDAKEVANFLNIDYLTIDISPMVDSYFDRYEPDATSLRRGNRMARERMCILYDLSAKYQALVAGTGNKSELLIGYCTQYGDNACAFETIGDLYKTEIRQISIHLNLPQSVINKNPSADLWEGQTDEDEIGMSYEKLDELLYNLYELNRSVNELINIGFVEVDIYKVIKMYKNSQFKREMPAMLNN
ncbi:MAG: NAD+ synthase [Candidatus Cloacimonetes bacterium]|nr:NAD+ synthase [Candidatus Cloacimonadota bacterium]